MFQANQHTPDPRQDVAWEIYLKRLSETGEKNAYKAGIEAGYSEDYSRSITLQDWWKLKVNRVFRLGLLTKAEKKFEEALEYPAYDEEKKFINVGLLKVQTDVAKHVTSTLGKAEGYSSRTELTGADGKDLPTPILGGITQHDIPEDNSGGENPQT